MKYYEELFKRLNLTREQVFVQSQREGKVGSWVFCCDTQECWLSDEIHSLFHLKNPAEFSLKSLLALIHPDDILSLKAAYKKILSRSSHQFVHRIIVDGKVKSVQEICKLYEGDGITPPYIIGSVHEISKTTRDLQTEHTDNLFSDSVDYINQLEQSVALEKMKGEYFANLSHEFKTPLNIIISSLDLLKLKICRDNEELFESDYKKFISYAYQNCYKLLRLTTNLLDSIKIDNQYLKCHFSFCEIVRLAEEITKSAAIYANARGITIEFTSDVNSTTSICCDMDMIDRILLNLISNAIKNTPNGGKVAVHFLEEDEYIVISVKDNGVGIPEDVLPNVFEKFQVSEKGLVGNYDGSGIGLSIVKSLVEMHNGNIWVESQVGNGSCFTFTISKKLVPDADSTNKLADGMDYDFEARQSRVKMELSNIS